MLGFSKHDIRWQKIGGHRWLLDENVSWAITTTISFGTRKKYASEKIEEMTKYRIAIPWPIASIATISMGSYFVDQPKEVLAVSA